MIAKSKLSVSIHEVEFSKDFRYRISIGFDKQKKETDVSALARNPIFISNSHHFDLPSNHTLQGTLIVPPAPFSSWQTCLLMRVKAGGLAIR
jgi:hypothetical protein